MQSALVLLLCALTAAQDYHDIAKETVGGGQAGLGDNEEFDAFTYLERAGYLDDLDSVKNRFHAPDNVKQALKEFQHFAGLPITGRLDKASVKQMKLPRCGVPDVIKPSKRPEYLRNLTDDISPLAYSTIRKWDKNKLKYIITKFTKDLTEDQQSRTIAQAFKYWADVTPLKFVDYKGNHYIEMKLSFARGRHGDCPHPFHGANGQLAHSFPPGMGYYAGQLHFDDDEHWTLDDPEGTDLLQIATHEIGHALGLDHSKNRKAVMYAYETGYIENFKLHEDDILGIQSLYGPHPGGVQSTSEPRPTSRPRQTLRPTRRPSGPNCNMKFDAISQLQDGNIYAFVGQNMYTITKNGPMNQQRISSIFKGAPTTPGAVAYDRFKKKLYFFKGAQVWRFTGYILDITYPHTLPRDFHNIDSAMQRADHAIYVFQGSNFARWIEAYTSYTPGFPCRIDSYFGSGPSSVDATFHASNDHLYMFQGKKYWAFLEHNRREVVAPNYPKDMRPNWLGCGESDGTEDGLFGNAGK